ILVFAETLGPRDDHGANRVRALDVAVIVDLNAARGFTQAERLGERREQVLLRLRFGKLAPKRLARIRECVIDQFLLLAAPWQRDLDLMPAFHTQRLREQCAILNLVRQEDAARRRLVVIELREKRAEYLARFERAV